MPVFFVKQINEDNAILEEDESRHLVKVLRLKKGDPVDLVDGEGSLFNGLVREADPVKTRVSILKTTRNHLVRNYHLHIAIAPTKSTDRFEWFLEKSTEIGIDEITPILCERSERNRIRQDRSEKIILAAMKQSGRAYLPKLNPMVPFVDLVTQADEDIKFIAHCDTGNKDKLLMRTTKKNSWLILIGPEGDFTPEELRVSMESNFHELNLGDAVYRTETAGIIVCLQIGSIASGREFIQ